MRPTIGKSWFPEFSPFPFRWLPARYGRWRSRSGGGRSHGAGRAGATRLEPADLWPTATRVREAGDCAGTGAPFRQRRGASVDEVEALLRGDCGSSKCLPTAVHEWRRCRARWTRRPRLAGEHLGDQPALVLFGRAGDARRLAARLHHVALIVGDLAGVATRSASAAGSGAQARGARARRRRPPLAGDWNPTTPGRRRR